jgi:DedD protein
MATMKKIFDERTKHRVVGVIVVLALMIIFLPAMIRESDKNFDEFTSYRVPKKPPMPKVSVIEPKAMLRSVKTAAVVTIPKPQAPVHLAITAAEPISPNASQKQIIQSAENLAKKMQISERNSMKYNEIFTIQLASFNKEKNAQVLVNKLLGQGFAASKQIVNTPQGTVYQVVVGQLKQRDQAIDLQKKLVDNTQLNGLIIKTKVS